MYTVQTARKKLDRLQEKIGGKFLSVRSLCQHLNNTFRCMSVRFTSKHSDSFSITGYFAGSVKIENELLYNIHINYDDDTKTIEPIRMTEELFLVMVHEFRHGHQQKQRNRKVLSELHHSRFFHPDKTVREIVNYLSDPDEIDAYAYEQAYIMNKDNHTDNFWIWDRYREWLDMYSPKAYKKFMKKVYLFLDK